MRTLKAAMAGRMSGTTINQKIRTSLTPSTLADSISSKGNARMKLRINRVQNPV